MANKDEKVLSKKSEKLGEMVGRRRFMLGGVLLLIGILFSVAVPLFQTGQDMFLRDGFMAQFLPSTVSAGGNPLGSLGATFCALSLLLIGIGTWLIPPYLIWIGIMCLRRRSKVLDLPTGFAMAISIVALACLGSIFQSVFDAQGATAYFLSGWGGKLGASLFDYVLRPTVDVFGSGAIMASVYLVCLIIIFVENPIVVAYEVKDSVKKAPAILPTFFGRLWFGVSYIPKQIFILIYKLIFNRKKKTIESENGDKILAAGVQPAPSLRELAETSDAQLTPPETSQDVRYEHEAFTKFFDADNASLNSDLQSKEDVAETQEVLSDNIQRLEVSEPAANQDESLSSSEEQNLQEPSEDPYITPIRSTAFGVFAKEVAEEPLDTFETPAFESETESEITHEDNDTSIQDEPALVEAPQEESLSQPEVFEEALPSEDSQDSVTDNEEKAEDFSEDFQKEETIVEAEQPEVNKLQPTPYVQIPVISPAAIAPSPAPEPEVLKVERIEKEIIDVSDIELPKERNEYKFPPLSLLTEPKPSSDADDEDYELRMQEIIETFAQFKVTVTREGVYPGPVITRYEVKLAPGVKISKVLGLEDDVALGLKEHKVRIVAPVAGRGTIGVEVPNRKRENVLMRDIIQSKAWSDSKAEIPIVLGKDVTGVPKVLDLAKMPHALIAGSTGSGKSVCMNAIIGSLLYKKTPEDLRFIMVDPKVVELQIYNSLPHMLIPVVTEIRKVPAALKWLIAEMQRRYEIFAQTNVKNIAGFNAKILKDKEEQELAEELAEDMTAEESAAVRQAQETLKLETVEVPQKKLPYIVCIIDELADIMLVAGKEVELAIMRLTALARAAGIHLLVATQRPSVDVITGIIKANLPTRIAFKVKSVTDSRTILDSKGAEALIGWGDMLFIPPGSAEPVRAQGAFLDDSEIGKIVDFLKCNGEPEYEEDIQNQIDASLEDENADSSSDSSEGGEGSEEDFVKRAMDVIRKTKKASISNLQRKLGIGYNKAARIIDELEERGLVGPDNGSSKPRDIYFD